MFVFMMIVVWGMSIIMATRVSGQYVNRKWETITGGTILELIETAKEIAKEIAEEEAAEEVAAEDENYNK